MPIDPWPHPADPAVSGASNRSGRAVEVVDAMELVQLLAFLGEWLDSSDGPVLNASLQRFAHAAYDITDLRADVARFEFLLGGDDRFAGSDHQPASTDPDCGQREETAALAPGPARPAGPNVAPITPR